jgi:hypothetical protein
MLYPWTMMLNKWKIVKGDKLVKLTNVNKFFLEAYQLMKKTNLFIWGIYPVRNAFL